MSSRAFGWSLAEPTGLRTDLAGRSITVVMDADEPWTPWEEAVVARFSNATGIDVRRVAGSANSSERIADYVAVLSSESEKYDAMMIDMVWPGMLADHAIDLSDVAISADYFPAIIENNTVEARLIAIPWYSEAGHIFVRRDLLNRYGLDRPPETWSELEQQSAIIQQGERSSGNQDFWGFVWQGLAYEGLTCSALEWQCSEGGGVIIESDGTVTVNNPAVRNALNRAAKWVGTISPPEVLGFAEDESCDVWQAGNAAFMRNWSYAWLMGQEPTSPVRDRFEMIQMPRGDSQGASRASCVGGWGWMASRYSRNPEAAIEFCRYVTSLDVQRSFALERNLPPTIPVVFADPDVVAVNPFFPELSESLITAVARPSTVSKATYNDVSQAYSLAVNSVLAGKSESTIALANLEQGLRRLMAPQ